MGKDTAFIADIHPANSDWLRFGDPDSDLYGMDPNVYNKREKHRLAKQRRGKKKSSLKKKSFVSAEKWTSLPIEQRPPIDYPVWRPITQADLQPGSVFRVMVGEMVEPQWVYVGGDYDGKLVTLVADSYRDIQMKLRQYAFGTEEPDNIDLTGAKLYVGDGQ